VWTQIQFQWDNTPRSKLQTALNHVLPKNSHFKHLANVGWVNASRGEDLHYKPSTRDSLCALHFCHLHFLSEMETSMNLSKRQQDKTVKKDGSHFHSLELISFRTTECWQLCMCIFVFNIISTLNRAVSRQRLTSHSGTGCTSSNMYGERKGLSIQKRASSWEMKSKPGWTSLNSHILMGVD